MNSQIYYGCFLSSFLGSVLSKYDLLSQLFSLLLIITLFFLGVISQKKFNITEEYLNIEKYKNTYNKIYLGIQYSFNNIHDKENHSQNNANIDENNENKKDL